jgi:hypothetical protein
MPASKSEAEAPAGQDKTGDPPLGQIAYEAYVGAGDTAAGFSSISGARLPSWDGADARVRSRWEAAAAAVATAAVAAYVRANPPPDADPPADAG